MDNLLIKGTSIDEIWYKMLNILLSGAGKELSPVLISLHDFDPNECEKPNPLREALEIAYKTRGLNSLNTVANTIFPQSLYNLARFDRKKLYEFYLSTLERRRAIDNRNRDGLYFERLIAFDDSKNSNQLEFIISEFTRRAGVRRSMLQAAIFDPRRDHKTAAQLGFPCLQHVTFTYVKRRNQLSVNAFYATQQLFDKAYGNMLGLVRLGSFMAKEMGLSLYRVNCYVGVEKLERITKNHSDIKKIVLIAKQYFGYE